MQRLQAGDGFISLAVLDGKGLASGAEAGSADLFNIAAWSSIVPHIPFRYCKQVIVSARWSSAMTKDLHLVQTQAMSTYRPSHPFQGLQASDGVNGVALWASWMPRDLPFNMSVLSSVDPHILFPEMADK